MKRAALLLALASIAFAGHSADARLNKSFRRPVQAGWIFVHLEGKPSVIGYQHGYLLAPEIADNKSMLALEQAHSSGKDWQFFRDAARTCCGRTLRPSTARS